MDVFLSRAQQHLLRKGQVLLCGAPGSGRAALAERLAERLVSGGDGLRERLVFHAAWSYEDFIQRQLPNGGRRAGRFLSLCQAAAVRRDACVLIIHDIQRAAVESVLGEALTMLEQRGRETTLCGGGRLSIPPNLLVIGTFDTSDASAPETSLALQQRFAHVYLEVEGEGPSEDASQRGLAGVGSVP
jgi:5-methylcytosine-specific restriction protein B